MTRTGISDGSSLSQWPATMMSTSHQPGTSHAQTNPDRDPHPHLIDRVKTGMAGRPGTTPVPPHGLIAVNRARPVSRHLAIPAYRQRRRPSAMGSGLSGSAAEVTNFKFGTSELDGYGPTSQRPTAGRRCMASVVRRSVLYLSSEEGRGCRRGQVSAGGAAGRGSLHDRFC